VRGDGTGIRRRVCQWATTPGRAGGSDVVDASPDLRPPPTSGPGRSSTSG